RRRLLREDEGRAAGRPQPGARGARALRRRRAHRAARERLCGRRLGGGRVPHRRAERVCPPRRKDRRQLGNLPRRAQPRPARDGARPRDRARARAARERAHLDRVRRAVGPRARRRNGGRHGSGAAAAARDARRRRAGRTAPALEPRSGARGGPDRPRPDGRRRLRPAPERRAVAQHGRARRAAAARVPVDPPGIGDADAGPRRAHAGGARARRGRARARAPAALRRPLTRRRAAPPPPPALPTAVGLLAPVPRAPPAVYRLSGGRLGGSLSGRPMLLLTTVGRRSGRERTLPLLYVEDGGRWVVVASNAGDERDPAWWLNLRARPEAAVQAGRERHAVRARRATPEEEARLWPRLLEA